MQPTDQKTPDASVPPMDVSGQPVEVQPGNAADQPAHIAIKPGLRICVSFCDDDMHSLASDIFSSRYQFIASAVCQWVPSGRLSDPEHIKIAASIEVTCAVPSTMTAEEVASELRAAVQTQTAQRLTAVAQMMMIADFGTDKAAIQEMPAPIHAGHSMPPGETGIIADSYTANLPPDHIASPACWCRPTTDPAKPGMMWQHRAPKNDGPYCGCGHAAVIAGKYCGGCMPPTF